MPFYTLSDDPDSVWRNGADFAKPMQEGAEAVDCLSKIDRFTVQVNFGQGDIRAHGANPAVKVARLCLCLPGTR